MALSSEEIRSSLFFPSSPAEIVLSHQSDAKSSKSHSIWRRTKNVRKSNSNLQMFSSEKVFVNIQSVFEILILTNYVAF